ncbi:ABC transporter substrate-binding protein [Sedimentitalea sp. JM2-8]|uniref:ABC transporter substrate-binding protein n=1 Tax=Sedimentitalea xiamensis TaxID=3050037 RepID=A0ABT7FAB4_9RHOB|nr:ABC transporter substrate-binding protein [Sedimentitalea xiamensis]MDK3072049.1 ABC transporter substrate-binding protein [Sedimentitalea xiamensis]
MFRSTILGLGLAWLSGVAALADLAVSVTYLQQATPRPPVLSNLDPDPENLGIAGARLGLTENETTGRFLNHAYHLDVVEVPEDGDLLSAARTALATSAFLILDMPAADAQRVADLPEAAGALLFNAAAGNMTLRDDGCRANLFHTIPSDAMRADALMQFAVFKRWDKLAMIAGAHPDDIAFATALKRSAVKFGIGTIAEKTWDFDADMRRNAAQEVPLFTQDFGDYAMMLVADELHDFGRYVAYNTWVPRPVAGSEGLRPVAWDRVVEQWGAAQLQNRFVEMTGRDMAPRDYAAWAAMRSLGEAMTRTNADDAATLRDFLLSDGFELAGFKGRPLSFRTWNGQMRQPIPLVTDRALVALAPLDGYLHQRSEMDTLGLDEPESRCEAFK